VSLDLRQLNAFRAVAAHEGFSRASREVNLTQPTLSTHISNLEKRLGVKLFDRKGRRVSLTPAGVLFAQYADRIIELCDESVDALQNFTGSIKGDVTVEASTVPGEYLLPRWLVGFTQRYPEVNVTLSVSDSEAVIHKIINGVVSIGIIGSKPIDTSVETRLLINDELIFIINPELAEVIGKSTITINELKDIPFIRREAGSGTQRAVDNALNSAQLSRKNLKVVATLGSTRAVIEGVISGMGGSFVSRDSVLRELADETLNTLAVEGISIDRSFYIITKRGKTLPPAARRLFELLLEESNSLLRSPKGS